MIDIPAGKLPEGTIIKHVTDRDGRSVINVSDANGDWQAAIPVGEDEQETIQQVITSAWAQELMLQHNLLIAEARAEFNDLLRGIEAQYQDAKQVRLG